MSVSPSITGFDLIKIVFRAADIFLNLVIDGARSSSHTTLRPSSSTAVIRASNFPSSINFREVTTVFTHAVLQQFTNERPPSEKFSIAGIFPIFWSEYIVTTPPREVGRSTPMLSPSMSAFFSTSSMRRTLVIKPLYVIGLCPWSQKILNFPPYCFLASRSTSKKGLSFTLAAREASSMIFSRALPAAAALLGPDRSSGTSIRVAGRIVMVTFEKKRRPGLCCMREKGVSSVPFMFIGRIFALV